MKQARKFRRTTLISVGLACFLLGLWLARIAPPLLFGWVLLSAVFVALCAKRQSILTIFAVVLLGVFAGWWRGGMFLDQLEPYRTLSGKTVSFVAAVQNDATYNKQGQLSFDVHNIYFIEPVEATVPGKIVVSGFGERAVYRGDTLHITGKLSPIRGSRQARVSFSAFQAVERNRAVVEEVRRSFVAGVTTALPEPSASFGLGLLVGYRTTLPEITEEQLAITGLTHIIAVSGYNLTIIVRGIRRLLKNWSKYQQTVICTVLIILFLLVTDFSASIVRASIVSGLSLLAWYYGRQFRPILLILLAAVLTAGFNPLYIWSDIGWYLSFLAFFGILMLAPLASRLVYGRRKDPPGLSLLLFETTAAQVMTAPLILFIFSRVSLIGIISNIVIGPLVPIAMLFTLAAGLAGMFMPVLSGFIALPGRMLLRYMLDIIAAFSKVPHALVERSINLWQMLVLYGLIFATAFLMYRKVKRKYGTITDKHTII